ncbi:amidase [Ktedonobacter racemifer]|uniref:Amidase n=1 Tax=Ktedonobacter racemifer DSM 44963 TaxID=485913 RepID=D6TTK4_KTERA|nr:amidase family protein [Ktedonobacter racemifer]EFH83755.1 Amidase [Ktedonobacter racemifer DSM 44963]
MDIVFASTTQLASAIRKGHVSATEVLQVHLAQIEAHNPTLNAVITLDAERAYERAREADAALGRGEIWGPLHGVPFTLKDAHATAGMRTTTGFPPLADYVPQEDSTVAARLKAAGGILMGKTNVPTMLADYQSANPIFGSTNNPWNVERTPGGSSGGAAAALASGMTPFEIGTDLSASIRIPAHFCGVFGLKPTEQRVPLTGMIPGLPGPRPVRIMSCIGPMARSVEDLALLYALIAGPDGQDTEVAPVLVDEMPELALKNLRVAFAPTFPGIPVATEIRTALEELAQQLTPLCATVEEATLPQVDFNQDLARAGAMIGMMTGAFQPEAQEHPTTLAQYLEALHYRDQSILAWERFFDEWDILLCPPTMVTAFPHCQPGSPIQVDDQEVTYYMTAAYGTLFNYTGHPVAVLPYKRDQAGLPIGIQVVGKRWQESFLLAVAQALTEVTGEFQRPPGF